MDSRMLIEDTADILDCLGCRLSRVTRAYDQLGFDTVDMRALVLDDAIVTALHRSGPLHRNDGMSVYAGGDRHRRERLQERIGGVHVVQRGWDNKRGLQHAGLAQLRDVDRSLGQSARQVDEFVPEFAEKIACEKTAAMRCCDEDYQLRRLSYCRCRYTLTKFGGIARNGIQV